MDDPLEGLLVDGQAVDRKRLAEVLKDLVALDSESGNVVFLDGFDRLPHAKAQVLVYLLALKASYLMGRVPEEAASPSAISRALNIPSGTVGRTVRELSDLRLVAQNQNGQYFVVPRQIPAVQGFLFPNG